MTKSTAVITICRYQGHKNDYYNMVQYVLERVIKLSFVKYHQCYSPLFINLCIHSICQYYLWQFLLSCCVCNNHRLSNDHHIQQAIKAREKVVSDVRFKKFCLLKMVGDERFSYQLSKASKTRLQSMLIKLGNRF